MKKIYQETIEITGNFETPITLFLKLRGKGETFLLESGENSESIGRFSFIVRNPLIRLIGKKGQTKIIKDGNEELTYDKMLDSMRNIMNDFELNDKKDYFDFGFIGYFGFDLIKEYERIPSENKDPIGMPEAHMIIPREVIVYDHLYRVIRIHVNGYEEEKSQLHLIARDIKDEIVMGKIYGQREIREGGIIESNISKADFERSVEKAKEYIDRGDIFQVVLSQRFSADYKGDAFNVYQKLRNINPSPYMYYLEYNNYSICGSSPESLVKVKNSVISTNPIAGTRKRGRDCEEDQKNRDELMNDEKELAEHLMLLDLGRNDIGKVAEFGTVKIPTCMEVKKFSHVMHICSTVEGHMRKDKDMYDGLVGCFPAGTVSGAPKIRAMEIIDELEGEKRGVYAGAVGYFSIHGYMDTCIAIRTMIFKDKKVYFQSGAGIVKDSIPESEYFETINKAMALTCSLGGNYDFDNR